MYQDAMIDIETLSTKNNAVILNIGAIKFYTGKVICPLENTAKSCKKLNMDIYKNTVQSRNNQPDQ
jgi:hypothetical protein